MEEELRPLPWRNSRQKQKPESIYTSFASMDGMEEVDDSKAIGATESLRYALRTGLQVAVKVLFMPPMIVAEACSEDGGLDCPRMRLVSSVLTKRRLCVGWIALNVLTPIALYSVSSPAMAKAVLGVHVTVLLSTPTALIGVALMDPKGWEMRDARGFEREVGSEHILDVRPNRDNVLKGISAVLVQLQFVLLQFGVPVVDPGGSPFRLPGEGGTIWGEVVDQYVSYYMHYALDILWWVPYWSRYSDAIVSALIWATLAWCAAAQVANERKVEDERQAKSRSLRMAYSSLTGIGLFCVVVALIRGVSRYMECPTFSGSDGLEDGYCSIALPEAAEYHGLSISSMLYRRPPGALKNLCGKGLMASRCSCVNRTDSRGSALIAVFTMSYFTVWAVFVRSVPSIAATISAADLDIIAPQPVQAAECLTRIVVASVCTIASPHMGRQGDKALAVLSSVVATSGAVLLCARFWTSSNVRNVNQVARTVTACSVWIGACSVWATLDQSCINDHKAVALGAGCATIAAGAYARSVCCRRKVAVGARESLLSTAQMADTTVDTPRKSFRDIRPEYGLHTRRSLQRCRLLGLCVVVLFTIAMVAFAWVAGLDKCKEFSAMHDGMNTTHTIEGICWPELDTECIDLRKPDSSLDRHRTVQAWQNMHCTGVRAGDVCTLPSPACEPGWLAVQSPSYSHQLTTATAPKCLDGANITCNPQDYDQHLRPYWSSQVACKKFVLEDLINRTTSRPDEPACKPDGLPTHREWMLNLPEPTGQIVKAPIVKAPCINVCPGTKISIVGDPHTTWVGSQVNRTQSDSGEVESRLLFEVRSNGTLGLSNLRINRTGWDEEEPADSHPYLVVYQNAIMVRRQAYAAIQDSILRGIQLYVDPNAASLNVSNTALVPLVDRHDGGAVGKQNNAQGGAAGRFQLHPSCITVCRALSTKTYPLGTGLCDDTAQPQEVGTGNFLVSDSILSMVYLNTPRPLPSDRSYITFSRATFYMSSLVGGQPVTQPGNLDQKKLMYTDAMASDDGRFTPLFPISRSILLDEDKVVRPNLPNRELLSATFVRCHLAGCSSTYDFCEGQPTVDKQELATQLAAGTDVFAQLDSLGQEYSLRLNVTASTPTFGDRLLFSIDVLQKMKVTIVGASNATSGSVFFLKGVFRRDTVGRNGEMWFFLGGHLRIENLRMDYCVDEVVRGSWLPSKNDNNVGDADASVSSLTLVKTRNLYTHIFRKGAQIGAYQGGRLGMPNYEGVVVLMNISIASHSAMDACCYTDCARPECQPILTVSTATEGHRRFLKVTQLAPDGRLGAWQDQLFDWNVSWYGTYMGRQSHATPISDATQSVLYLGGDSQRWGVSAPFHLELHNIWLVADLQTSEQAAKPCCRPGVKTNKCTSAPDSRCGACAPVDDGSVLKPIVGQGNDVSCTTAFASTNQPMHDPAPSSWSSGTISFHTVAIQYKRVQIQTNASCDNVEDTCKLQPMETMPLNIMGAGTPFVLFEDCEFAQSADPTESASTDPMFVFAAFSMTTTWLNITLIRDSPLLLWDLRQSDTSDGAQGSSPSRVALREISIVGNAAPADAQRQHRQTLQLRRLLLSDRQHAAVENLNMNLSLDFSRALQPPLIKMVNVGILSQNDATTQHSPFGVFSGLTHWDTQTCTQEQSWCVTMQNVTIFPPEHDAGVLATSPCIDQQHDLPIAVVNSATRANGNSRLDIVVSGDNLDFGKAVRAASAQATVTVSGRTNVMWCDSVQNSNGNSRNGTACSVRVNSSTSCTGAPGSSNRFFTRAPRVIGANLQDLKTECGDKLCVLQNVSLKVTNESISHTTNESLRSFASCPQNHLQGVRFGHVELEQFAEADDSPQRGPLVTLMEQCADVGERPSLDDLVGTCDCTQWMWRHQ